MKSKISTEDLHQQAQLYLAQGKLEEAMAACKQALEMEPNFPLIYKILGNILQRIGEIDQAKEWYIKAINLEPNWAEVYANLGSLYAQQKKWQLAIECYDKAIKIKPKVAGFYRNLEKIWQCLDKPDLATKCKYQALKLEPNSATACEHLQLGKKLLEQQELEAAIACFERALEFNSSLTIGYQNLGDALVEKGELKKAISCYQKAIELQPNKCFIHHKSGKAWQEMGEIDRAITEFNLAIEIDPNFPWAYRNLGDILQQKGNLEAAEKCYKKLIDLKPNTWNAQLKLTNILLQQGKLEAVINLCKQVIEINPNLTWPYQKLGDNLQKLGLDDEAVNCYHKLKEIEPNNIKWHSSLTHILMKLEKWDEAVDAFYQGIELNQNLSWWYYNLGEALRKMQRLDEAILVYRRAIELESDNHLSHRRLADIFLEKGLLDEAISSYQKAIEINPNLSWSHHNLGEALRKMQRLDEAILVYRRAIELEAYNHLFHRRLADVFQEKGLLDEAISSYQKAIEINPKCYGHYTALGNSYIKQKNWSEVIPCLIEVLKMRPDMENIHQNIAYVLKKQGRHDEVRIWKSQKKLPKDWLEKFFNLTGNWEVTSNSSTTNISSIKVSKSSQINLLPSQTIEPQIYPSFQHKKAKLAAAFVTIVAEGKGCVDLGTTAVITSDNKLVTDISTGCAEIMISSSQLPPVYEINGTVAFLPVNLGINNYFHWMFDVFVRLDLLRRSNLMSTIDKFVFTNCSKKFQKESIEALKISPENVIEARLFPKIKARELIVPSLMGRQGSLRLTKWGCNFLRSLFLKPENIDKLASKQERIYISRKLTPYRRIFNEEEVVNLLAELGFITVTLESISVAEQASLMASAKIIISPHGAGLTNLVFCSPGTKIIEIFSPKFINSIYWHLSNICGLSHYHLICEDYEDGSSVEYSWGPDIVVNLERLLKILKLAGI
ncbi:tetratricopeptide repeat protein [Dapis sp. BLCC M172]|uniref:tetratricopeptide repeat protein n=1 Tax=Dapis sp. BLCC M172 TaxID=2975281 RepID=UPI003CEAE050